MKRITQSRSGQIMVVALFFIAVLSLLAGSAFDFTSSNARNAQREESRAQAQALAEGCLEVAYAQWRRYVENNLDYSSARPPDGGDLNFISSNPPTSVSAMASAFNVNGVQYTVDEYRVVALDENGGIISDPDRPPDGVATYSDAGAGFNNGTVRIYRYLATAQVSRQSAAGTSISARVGRTFEVKWAPLVSNAIFYEDTMDIFPGPRMDIVGTVHTNGTMYYGHDTLYFWERVTAASGMNNQYNPGDSRSGTPAMSNWRDKGSFKNYGDYSQNAARQEPVGINPGEVFDTTDSNANNDSFRELIERPSISGEDPEALKKLRFYNQADVKVLVDSTLKPTDPNRIKILLKDYNGNDSATTEVAPKLKADGTVDTSANNLYNKIRANIIDPASAEATNGGATIKDNREANSVFLTSVDVAKMTQTLGQASGIGKGGGGFNGIFYITDTSSNSSGGTSSVPIWDSVQKKYVNQSAEKGIRLRNGASFDGALTNTNNPNGGFTVASENGVYVQGDYNSGKTATANPPSNTSSTPPTAGDARSSGNQGNSTYNNFPEATGYDRKPAMVAGDAVMILSNSWNDSNSTKAMADRKASATTVNSAILTGNVPSQDEKYSGGVENFPRFLETWSGVNFTYYGSMIQLFKSKLNNGSWGTSNVYEPPNRRWYFDNMFRKKTPPGVAVGITNQRGRWVNLDPVTVQ